MSGPYATVIGIFENQYINNQKLTVVSPGTQSRCFTHINDILEGILLVAYKGSGDNYHIGCSEEIKIIDIVKLFDTEYVFIDEKKGERKSSTLKESKMSSEFNWKAKIKLKNYIKIFKNYQEFYK